MVFANILVKGWIVYPNVYSFFDQPNIVVLLSPHYGEIINSGVMTCDGSVVMYGGGVFQMLFKPFTKGSGWFSYILILTLHPITLVSIDDATFLSD